MSATTLNIPGVNGTVVANTISSSYFKKGVGQLTATNHLNTFWREQPQMYDKMINFYIQQEMVSSDLEDMLNKSTPYYLEISDSFQYDINKRAMYPKIIQNLSDTVAKPGIDGSEINLVFDKKVFVKGDTIFSHRFEQDIQLYIKEDPKAYSDGFLYTCTIVSNSPGTDFIAQSWLTVGQEYSKLAHPMGEFSNEFSGLSQMNDKLKVVHTLGAEYGVAHRITDWADAKTLKDEKGNPLDITYFVTGDVVKGSMNFKSVKWLPTVELMMQAEMKRMKFKQLMWQRGGIVNDEKGNLINVGSGLWEQLKRGFVHNYNRGEFSVNMLRKIFGDLFYRRVAMKNRKVVMWTNESGMNVFDQALKADAGASGLTIIANQNGILTGQGRSLTLSYAFDSMVTRDTGEITVKHLMELDAPTTAAEYGQNKYSTPIFLVFDLSTMNDGSIANNVREIRSKDRPGMRWGYVDGAVHHLGFAASQNMSSANLDPWYTCWMKDRCGIFVEDVTRCVMIKENPVY